MTRLNYHQIPTLSVSLTQCLGGMEPVLPDVAGAVWSLQLPAELLHQTDEKWEYF